MIFQLLAVLAGCDLVYLVTMLLESIRKFGLETRFFIFNPFFVSPFSAPDSISFSSQTFSSPSMPSPWWPPSTWLLPLLSKGAEHALFHDSIIHNCFCDTFQIWRVPIQVLGSLSSSGLQQDGNRCKFSSQVEILLFWEKKIFSSYP